MILVTIDTTEFEVDMLVPGAAARLVEATGVPAAELVPLLVAQGTIETPEGSVLVAHLLGQAHRTEGGSR